MRRFAPKIFLSFTLLSLFQLTAVAQYQQSWLKKTWHNMNARYNGLYHAKVAIAETKTALREQHVDDFNQIISVFPYGTPSQREAQLAPMEEVYKKCSQVIKKHPKSRWVDDAWFLIGESYFYRNELFSAIETYQYVSNQYPNGERKYDAKLGILMSYIIQKKYYDAEAIMSIIKKDGNFPNRLQKQFSAIAAEIYIHQEKYDQAIVELQKALELSKVRDEKSRYHFILGQLQLKVQTIEPSKENFIKTIKLNPPYELAFQANLGLIKTIGLSAEKSLKTPRKYLKKMLDDDKNIDYYDQIYYELANLEMQAGNITEAIAYYQKSAQTSVKNQDQKANSYLALATIYFDQKDYKISQKYFDSTAMFMSDARPDYEKIKAKQLVLTDLIENLINIYTQDSLLDLSNLTKEELDKKINAQIAYEAEQKRIEDEKKANGQPVIDNFDPFNNPNKVNTNNTVAGGTWYFYNQSAVARGTNDFKRKWGSRGKTDLWRYASMQSGLEKKDNPENKDSTDSQPKVYDQDQDEKTKEILSGVDQDKKKYYKNIPFSQEAKAASNAKIEEALFNTGKIYYEGLKEAEKSKEYLLQVLKRYPGSEFEPETYFILNKIETELGNTDKAEEYSKLLNQKYPKNPFNLVLNNRDLAEQLGGSNEVSKLYAQAYEAYQKGDNELALKIKAETNQKYAGNSLQAQFDYLQALIIGKTKGKAEYVKELQRIVDLYPGTKVANQADYTIQLLQEKEGGDPNESASKSYAFDPSEVHYFIVLYDGGNKGNIMAGFSDHNREKYSSKNLKVNSYVVGDKNVIAIQTFSDKNNAEEYYVEFIKNDKFFKDLGIRAYDLYTISQSNFRTLLVDANTDAYSLFFVRNYIQ